jgi:hypothetical protein
MMDGAIPNEAIDDPWAYLYRELKKRGLTVAQIDDRRG